MSLEKKSIPETKDKRCRWWTIEVYPDSAKENWERDLIGMKYAISPLHNEDKNDDGTIKKPHWHVVIYFPNKAYLKEVQELSFGLSKVKYVQPVKNICGMIRYLVHMDNPEKAQYKIKDIKTSGGFDINQYLRTSADDFEIQRKIEVLALEKKIFSYGRLCDYLYQELYEDSPELYQFLTRHTFHFLHYLKSYKDEANFKKVSPGSVSDLADEVEL